jgi:hypothetical protein
MILPISTQEGEAPYGTETFICSTEDLRLLSLVDRTACQDGDSTLAYSSLNDYDVLAYGAARRKEPEMKEQSDVDFKEPVVLVRAPFRMVAEVARETVNRTHDLVMRLTRNDAETLARTNSAATTATSR